MSKTLAERIGEHKSRLMHSGEPGHALCVELLSEAAHVMKREADEAGRFIDRLRGKLRDATEYVERELEGLARPDFREAVGDAYAGGLTERLEELKAILYGSGEELPGQPSAVTVAATKQVRRMATAALNAVERCLEITRPETRDYEAANSGLEWLRSYFNNPEGAEIKEEAGSLFGFPIVAVESVAPDLALFGEWRETFKTLRLKHDARKGYYFEEEPRTAEANCSKACYGQERCPVGWADGSCGARPEGTARPPIASRPFDFEDSGANIRAIAEGLRDSAPYDSATAGDSGLKIMGDRADAPAPVKIPYENDKRLELGNALIDELDASVSRDKPRLGPDGLRELEGIQERLKTVREIMREYSVDYGHSQIRERRYEERLEHILAYLWRRLNTYPRPDGYALLRFVLFLANGRERLRTEPLKAEVAAALQASPERGDLAGDGTPEGEVYAPLNGEPLTAALDATYRLDSYFIPSSESNALGELARLRNFMRDQAAEIRAATIREETLRRDGIAAKAREALHIKRIEGALIYVSRFYADSREYGKRIERYTLFTVLLTLYRVLAGELKPVYEREELLKALNTPPDYEPTESAADVLARLIAYLREMVEILPGYVCLEGDTETGELLFVAAPDEAKAGKLRRCNNLRRRAREAERREREALDNCMKFNAEVERLDRALASSRRFAEGLLQERAELNARLLKINSLNSEREEEREELIRLLKDEAADANGALLMALACNLRLRGTAEGLRDTLGAFVSGIGDLTSGDWRTERPEYREFSERQMVFKYLDEIKRLASSGVALTDRELALAEEFSPTPRMSYKKGRDSVADNILAGAFPGLDKGGQRE